MIFVLQEPIVLRTWIVYVSHARGMVVAKRFFHLCVEVEGLCTSNIIAYM